MHEDKVNRYMHPPLHLFLFSLKSLEILLNKHGYKVTNVWYYGQDFYEFITTLALCVKNLDSSVLYKNIAWLVNDFQNAIDRRGLSDEILIISSKII